MVHLMKGAFLFSGTFTFSIQFLLKSSFSEFGWQTGNCGCTMIFLPAKIFCQSNGLFHPKDLLAAFHDLAFQGIAQFPFGISDGSAGDAPFQRRLVDVLAEHLLSSGK